MNGRGSRSLTAILALAGALMGVLQAGGAWAASLLTLGPRSIQNLVAEQLFTRSGRWYLIDDGGGCFTYLESPHTHLAGGRLILDAHLASRFGASFGNGCAGAEFASNVRLSGRLRGAADSLALDDIRIDRVDDEATRDALNLALQLSPDALPRTASLDVRDLLRKQALSASGLPVRVDQFRIGNIAIQADAVLIQFDVNISAP